jgi:hypothetical protein
MNHVVEGDTECDGGLRAPYDDLPTNLLKVSKPVAKRKPFRRAIDILKRRVKKRFVRSKLASPTSADPPSADDSHDSGVGGHELVHLLRSKFGKTRACFRLCTPFQLNLCSGGSLAR